MKRNEYIKPYVEINDITTLCQVTAGSTPGGGDNPSPGITQTKSYEQQSIWSESVDEENE
jgi:hypothetical protein